MLELDEVKAYLRIDCDEENSLVTSLILMATELVEDIIRQKLSEFESVPESVRQAVLLAVATFYENRQVGKDGLNTADLIDMIMEQCQVSRQCFRNNLLKCLLFWGGCEGVALAVAPKA